MKYVTEDLATDSFINAVLRFVGRRGPPRVIYSDTVPISEERSLTLSRP